MPTPNQVAKDRQLLDTARDYFHFATTFFELIDISAAHIYHSALELSPLSSTVRKFYYHRRSHPLPRVVFGIPDSWDPMAISTKHSHYLSSTWSPCGQFVAAVAEEAVEIRDALTLELLSTLQSTRAATRFRHGVAYSPDGRSLAGCSDVVIVIWDAQTGGVIKEIERVPGNGLELVWSLDGSMIGAISPRVSETFTVYMYNIVTGATLSPRSLQSMDKPYLWAYGESFRTVTTARDRKGWKIEIFEVGSALTRIESFLSRLDPPFEAFSSTTYRISVSVTGDQHRGPELLVLDIRNSEVLLREPGSYWHASFSPDGSFFTAFAGDRLPVWRYTSGRYIQWREFRQTPTPLQFSPTSSSILGRAGALLHVLHLDHSPAALAVEPIVATHSVPRDAYSPQGAYIATAHRGESAVTITNLRSQPPSPSQFIDTDLEISEIVLTGNVLLVKATGAIVAWLLTEDGTVDGVFGNRWADRNDSLWDTSSRDAGSQLSRDESPSFWARLLPRERVKNTDDGHLEFSVGAGIAAVGHRNGFDIRSYRTGTGEILEPDKMLLHPGRTWYRFHNPHRDDCDLYHRDLRKQHEPSECGWSVSETILREGWVKDPEGKRRLWLHARWRSSRNDVDWLHDATALRLRNSSELVIVKF